MKTCPACNYAENRDDALVCIKCGTVFDADPLAPFIQKPTTHILSPDTLPFEVRIHEQHKGKLSRSDIAIYVADVEEPLIIPLVRELMLGRYGGVEAEDPANIDLAPFKAFEKGVSRKHAVLRRLGPDVVILDLESTNGTWLNGVSLKAHQPVTLRSGDRVLMARLMLQIYLP
ncbi:MAG: FHA domain-containing protein [Chloroflexota bacterium]